MSEQLTVVGNIASEPRQGLTGSGVPYLSFRVASDQRRWDRATGAWVSATPSFYTVNAYRSLAENAAGSLQVGDRVIVSGRFRLRDWADGSRRGTTAEIDADALGPELRWGRTVFHARPRQHEADDTAQEPGGAEIDSPEADALPVPF